MSAKKITLMFLIFVYGAAYLYMLAVDHEITTGLQCAILPFYQIGKISPFLPILQSMGLTSSIGNVLYPSILGASLIGLVSIILVYFISLLICRK